MKPNPQDTRRKLVVVAHKSKAAKPVKPVHLILMGDGSQRPFIGVHAVPNRLPELLRLPGESAQAFTHRALHHVAGSGVVHAKLIYPPFKVLPEPQASGVHSGAWPR